MTGKECLGASQEHELKSKLAIKMSKHRHQEGLYMQRELG